MMCKVLVLSNLALAKRKVEEAVADGTCLLAAETAEEAWQKITASGGVDFVVIDDELPEEDSLKLLTRIREKGQETPIIMLGDKTDSKRILRCFELGADDYVESDISPELLRAKLHVIMRRG